MFQNINVDAQSANLSFISINTPTNFFFMKIKLAIQHTTHSATVLFWNFQKLFSPGRYLTPLHSIYCFVYCQVCGCLATYVQINLYFVRPLLWSNIKQTVSRFVEIGGMVRSAPRYPELRNSILRTKHSNRAKIVVFLSVFCGSIWAVPYMSSLNLITIWCVWFDKS